MREFYSQAGVLLMLMVCLSAWRWGGQLERRVALLTIIAWTALLVAQAITRRAAPTLSLALMDGAVFAVMIRLVWRTRSDWGVYALAAQGVAIGVHVIRWLSPAMNTWTYLTALAISSYGVLAALAWGVWIARRERAGR